LGSTFDLFRITFFVSRETGDILVSSLWGIHWHNIKWFEEIKIPNKY